PSRVHGTACGHPRRWARPGLGGGVRGRDHRTGTPGHQARLLPRHRAADGGGGVRPRHPVGRRLAGSSCGVRGRRTLRRGAPYPPGRGLEHRRTLYRGRPGRTRTHRRTRLMSTGTIALADSYSKTVPRELAAAASQPLVKLMMNPESPGLHVEPIQQAADPRIRSIRVNRQYRILAFHLPRDGKDHWVVNGVYDHDEAYRIARILYLRINPITGATEFRDDPAPTSTAADPSFEDSAFKRRVAEEVARELAEREEREARE